MDFAARLERLRQLQREREARSGRSGEATPGETIAAPESGADNGAGFGLSPYAPEAALELSSIETPEGRAFVHERVYPLAHFHGRRALADALSIGDTAFTHLGGHNPRGHLPELLAQTAFLDVETTGLAGGTGVVAFLIGVARVAGDSVVLRQFFLRDFGEEAALLAAVDGALAGARTIVTYNGKIFDWPLLETRCVMNRMRFTAPVTGHIDLVFPARRIWQHHLPDCRLATVEHRILGHEREGDIPGELIPAIYFGYQRSGDARPLQPVLEHNRLDILSLVGILGVIGNALSDPFGGALRHAGEFHGLGRWCVDLGLVDAGVRCLERASREDLAPAARERVLKDLATVYKRLRQMQNAVAVWRSLVDAGALSAFPYVELAKHHEHVDRDYGRALQLVERAVELHRAHRRAGTPADIRTLDDLLHRRDRLRRKLERNVADRNNASQ